MSVAGSVSVSFACRMLVGVLTWGVLTGCGLVSPLESAGSMSKLLVTSADLGPGWVAAGPGVDGRLGWSTVGGQAAPFSKCLDVSGPEFIHPFSELEISGESFARVRDAGVDSVSSRVYPASGPADADALIAATDCVAEFAVLLADQESSRVSASAGPVVVQQLGVGGELGEGVRGLHLTIPLYPLDGPSQSADVVDLVASAREETAVYSMYSVGLMFDSVFVERLARLLALRINDLS